MAQICRQYPRFFAIAMAGKARFDRGLEIGFHGAISQNVGTHRRSRLRKFGAIALSVWRRAFFCPGSAYQQVICPHIPRRKQFLNCFVDRDQFGIRGRCRFRPWVSYAESSPGKNALRITCAYSLACLGGDVWHSFVLCIAVTHMRNVDGCISPIG